MNKKTLWGGVTAGAVALGLVGGGTFAGWSDFNVQTESIQAGHLTLNVGESVDVNDEALNLAPGINQYRHFFLASNDGQSVPNGALTVELENFVEDENGCENNGEADAEGNQNSIADDGDSCGTVGELSAETNMQWQRVNMPEGTDCSTVNYNGQPAVGPSGAIREQGPIALGTFVPGEGACIRLTVVAVDRNNSTHIDEIQGDSLDFDLRFTLTQV